MTTEQMWEDYWAHQFFDDPKAGEEIEDEGFNLEEVLLEMEQHPEDWETVATYGRNQDPR